MSNVNMYERRRDLFYPPLIIPTESLFTYKVHVKGSKTFAIVKSKCIVSIGEILDWLQGQTDKHWLIPTVTVAGEKWKINPKPTLEGWAWLFLQS